MKRVTPFFIFYTWGLILSASHSHTYAAEDKTPRSLLPQNVYVWQRNWNSKVCSAVSNATATFESIIALRAEVRWHDKAVPETTHIHLDYPSLKSSGHKVGLALRIGPFRGPFSEKDDRARYLQKLAQSMIGEARSNNLSLSEFQIDFDCATAHLDGYRQWVSALKKAVHPIPLTITTLPSWMSSPGFEPLIKSTDGYVLQVHSLAPPAGPNAPFTLCDTNTALAAVSKASRFSVPFQVALPTYGYFLAFQPSGKFLGLSAEGPLPNWPKDAIIRNVRSQPREIAALVQTWTRSIAPPMSGIIWYRLPVEEETLNWPLATLKSVQQGIVPLPKVEYSFTQKEPGLVEIILQNLGEDQYNGPVQLNLHWKTGRLIASDSHLNFEIKDTANNEILFNNPALQLGAGQSCSIGWVRFDRQVEAELTRKP